MRDMVEDAEPLCHANQLFVASRDTETNAETNAETSFGEGEKPEAITDGEQAHF